MDQDVQMQMELKRRTYVAKIITNAMKAGVKITQWELEEIEEAFEVGFRTAMQLKVV